jgi:non-lysosomal glucosylceramidase
LIYEGYVEEGLAIVKGVRTRHDGRRRNPWNEFECGSHYARSLASWSVLTALTGYSFDMPHHHLGFNPRMWPSGFKSLWTVDSGWGTFEQDINTDSATVVIQVVSGSLELASLQLGSLANARLVTTKLSQRVTPSEIHQVDGALLVTLKPMVQLETGQTLELTFQL